MPLTPYYNQSFYDWLSNLPEEYGGMPGEYGWTPESLLQSWGMSDIPGMGQYGEFAGILPTYRESGEDYLLNKYLLDVYGIGLGEETARREAGDILAETGLPPSHGFEEFGQDIATKTAQRDTVAKIMEETAETANIGQEQAQWNLAERLYGGRSGWTEDVVNAYNRWYANVVEREGEGEEFDYVTNEGLINAVCSENPDFPGCADPGDLDWEQLYFCYSNPNDPSCTVGAISEELEGDVDWVYDCDPNSENYINCLQDNSPDPEGLDFSNCGELTGSDIADCVSNVLNTYTGVSNLLDQEPDCMIEQPNHDWLRPGYGMECNIFGQAGFLIADWLDWEVGDPRMESGVCYDSEAWQSSGALIEVDCYTPASGSDEGLQAGDLGLGVTGNCWDTGCDPGYTCDTITGECV